MEAQARGILVIRRKEDLWKHADVDMHPSTRDLDFVVDHDAIGFIDMQDVRNKAEDFGISRL